MTTHDDILKMLKGRSSQNPMQFNALLNLCDLQGTSADSGLLDIVLDQLYAAKKINQSKVTRNGITQREVWPTGVVSNSLYLNSLRLPLTPPLRPAEVKPKLTEETMNPDLNLSDDKNEKARALQVLEFIEQNPGCTNTEINNHFVFQSPISYIKKHIEAEKLSRIYIGKRVAIYSLIKGFTAASIYGNGVKDNYGHGTTSSKTSTVQACRPQDKAMLESDAGKELVEKATAALKDDPITFPAPGANWGTVIDAPSTLKIAYTNHKTIMLFGLADSPIELSKEDSDELIDFCAQMDLCCSVDVPAL